jgi:hypothetical protein
MGKEKNPVAPQQSEAERDAMIDEHARDRFVGGADEGAAWAKAFGGGLQEEQADDSPLTPEEAAAVRDLMIHAAEQGDHESLDRLKALAANPAELRKVMAGFDPDA